jgi:hypothetical protein
VYTRIVSNFVTPDEAEEIEGIQQKLAALYQNCLFSDDHVTYGYFLEGLKRHTPHDIRFLLDALFLISVYSGSKCYAPPVDITGIRVLPCNFRKSSLLTVTCKTSPFASCVSSANRVCKDLRGINY